MSTGILCFVSAGRSNSHQERSAEARFTPRRLALNREFGSAETTFGGRRHLPGPGPILPLRHLERLEHIPWTLVAANLPRHRAIRNRKMRHRMVRTIRLGMILTTVDGKETVLRRHDIAPERQSFPRARSRSSLSEAVGAVDEHRSCAFRPRFRASPPSPSPKVSYPPERLGSAVEGMTGRSCAAVRKAKGVEDDVHEGIPFRRRVSKDRGRRAHPEADSTDRKVWAFLRRVGDDPAWPTRPPRCEMIERDRRDA